MFKWIKKVFTKDKTVQKPVQTKKRVESVYTQRPPVRESYRAARDTEAEDFLTSAAIAYATDSAVLGAIAGGSLTGAIVGDMLNNSSDNTSSYESSSDSFSSSCDNSSSYSSSDSCSDW